MNSDAIRRDFPILAQAVRGKPLVYLDNAATKQKPQSVIDAVSNFYAQHNANVHRGVHYLSECATREYEQARQRVAQFINAPSAEEIVFVRGCTEAINLVASSFGQSMRQGDEILISGMEHHSNIVPWQLLCERTGALLKVIPVLDDGTLDMSAYQRLLSDRTKLVSVVHVSNAIGTVNPVKDIIDLAHQKNIPVLIDGAQAASHLRVDVQALDADFYTLSGHKMYGPTGVGALYGKRALLDAMPPYQGGGEMITQVRFEQTTYNQVPYKFEAGTPNIAGAIGLAAAMDYIESIGFEAIHQHEQDLLAYATERLARLPGLRFIGTAPDKAGVISFLLGNVHAHDVGTIVDFDGVAVRAGHHCTMPLMDRFGVSATVRASFALYNTQEEVDTLVAALQKAQEMMG